jgi:hypothetical protein
MTPKQTPRYTPRALQQIPTTVRGATQLLNSADILSLSENEESLTSTTDPSFPLSHPRVSSQILFGDDDPPDLTDI